MNLDRRDVEGRGYIGMFFAIALGFQRVGSFGFVSQPSVSRLQFLAGQVKPRGMGGRSEQ